ncbi:MAG: branched-chain amino acid ABC transporter permease [Deltaproteobacteria bacterium]|nr:branched-chain amino acid ABC transporter permease [Deltaproteobacteria bacterium]
MWRQVLSILFVILLALCAPICLDQYWLHVAIISLYYILLSSSWNLIAGYTGLVSFAHAGFAALGAYSSGLLTLYLGLSPISGICIGTCFAGLAGLTLGGITLRLGGIYLSLTTLGFSEILRIIITNEEKWTRGTMGLQVPGLFSTYSKSSYYYAFLFIAIVVLILTWRLVHSNLGLCFRAVMDDELAANTSGVPTNQVRLIAFTGSSAIAGLAGALYGHYLMLITPDIGSLGQMFLILAMTMVGGLGTILGPVVGAIFLQVLSEKIRVYGEYHLLVFGLVTLVIVLFAPQGLMGLLKRRKA